MVDLTAIQKAILAQSGHLLVTGGPGSGKTTIAILKAAEIAENDLRPCQSILFLSFARATVARILEAMNEEKALSSQTQQRIDVDTYHAFFWSLLKTHGYLLGLPRRLEIITPPSEAVALSSIRRQYPAENKQTEAQKREKSEREEAERTRLAEQAGRVCFSLFARYAGKLLHSSNKVRRLVLEAFPVVILDEFQDTTADQWRVVKALGAGGTLIALADPEQRIFEFAGAEAKRLQQYRDTFHPAEFDLKADNHRSKGTDIAIFANDILTGRFTQERYAGVVRIGFEATSNQAFATVHGHTLQARKRLTDLGRKNWTVAVLVPTKKLTRLVSDTFRDPLTGMPPIAHSAAVDMEGPILAAEFLAFLLRDRGTQLRQALAADWRENGTYPNALAITRQAFVREHFSSAARPERGVIVMNMHKAKGKQFDEVIIFEGWPRYQGRNIVANVDRIVRNNERKGDMVQARQNFRVSVTRARQRTTILTPKS